jgi:hypothetical protein
MIVSASRRTDIPAFYGQWFMNRLRAGFCSVANPFNPKQVGTVSLRPEDVSCFVFWTRYPVSLSPHLPELLSRGHEFVMLYTVLDYSSDLEPGMPVLSARIREFRQMADRYSPDRMAWRYDPILISPGTDAAFHRDRFRAIASELRGATHRVIISFFDAYPKARARLSSVSGGRYRYEGDPQDRVLADLVPAIVETAGEFGMDIQSCAEKLDLEQYCVAPGACIDGPYLEQVTGRPMPRRKDAGQRKRCRCVESRDIGAYDTCRFGCVYCYATNRPPGQTAHDPSAPMLVG